MSTRDHPDWWRPVGGSNSQDSVLERRSTIWNDGDPVAPAAPPELNTGAKNLGKFFTRGCRGVIEYLQLYCRRAAAGTLDLSFSPHPCLGPLYTVTVTPGAAWAWAPGLFYQMWNYDSLFVWVSRCDADVSWGWDRVQPWDGHFTLDVGVTWRLGAWRMYARVVYTGETPGDVPVSGTINTIEIPSTASTMASYTGRVVPSNAVEMICEAEGAGTMFEARLVLETSAAPTAGPAPPAVWYQLRLIADGFLCSNTNNRDLTQSCVATSGRSSKGEFYQCAVQDPAWDCTVLIVRLPLKFRRSLALHAVHTTGVNVTVDGRIYANLIR